MVVLDFLFFVILLSGSGPSKIPSFTPGDGFRYWIFTSSGTFTVSSPVTASYLVVAGAGGGTSYTPTPAPNLTGGNGGSGIVIIRVAV